jgi:hypothetical protein
MLVVSTVKNVFTNSQFLTGASAMADTTKLAGTFTAWRLTIAVKPESLDKVLMRCHDLGLEPRVSGYEPPIGPLVHVFIPVASCAHPLRNFIEPYLGELRVALVQGVQVGLLCPVSNSV